MNKQDLIEGEIYFLSSDKWSNDYIELYKDCKGQCSHIRIPKDETGRLVFNYSFYHYSSFVSEVEFYRKATTEESNWLRECIKVNRIIPLQDIKPIELTDNYSIY